MAGSLIKVYGNIINDAYRGVYATNFKTPPIHAASNFVTLKPDPGNNTQYGISLNTCDNATVSTNNITGPNTTNTLITAIYASQNNNPSVTCNTVSTSYQGFEFAQSQPGTVWKGNSMTNHQRGFVLSNSGVIGQQGSSGNPIDNAWNGTWSTDQTYTDFSLATSSPLYVNTGVTYSPSLNSSNPLLQDYSMPGALYVTTGSYNCGGGGSGASMLSGTTFNSSTTSETILLEDISKDASNHIAQNQLYRYLSENPSKKSYSTQLQSFYNLNQNKNIGKLYTIEKELENGNFSSANFILSSITSSNTIEANYKDFYALYLKFYSGTWLTNDNNTLQSICNKCPFTDGAIVYQARTLYNNINSSMEIFADNCPSHEYSNSRFSSSKNNESNTNKSWVVNIFPNPASDELFINSNNETETLSLRITDVNGRLILDERIQTKGFNGQLKLSLKSGIYFITLINDKTESIIKKLVITKQ